MHYVFGRCRLDTSSRDLTRDGEAVHVQPKVFELIRFLIEARPRVLTKAELMEKLWPDAFVVEANLPVLVGEARAALGDQAGTSSAIKTHHGVGYNFVADVREMRSANDAPPEDGYVLVLRVGARRIALGAGVNTVGRDKDSDVFLNDASVSRAHARIAVQRGAVHVEDLSSKNGTWVQGLPIHEPTPLADGDELMFGTIRARFFKERPDDPTTQTL
jgi:DNA-binding winged helix-turn-helix (wHTH) protein